jgi:lactate dehydrogenase-like 2-hydroxyacid dehydrogenase
MEKLKVYITRMIPEAAIDMLKEKFDVEVNPYDRGLTREELLENVKGKNAVLCLLNDVIDSEVYDAAGDGCIIFANYAVGYNNIDIKEAAKRGIIITNTPGVLDNATAELAWSLLFASARRISESERYIRDGRFKGWSPTMFLGRDITGKTVGIAGAGRIGCNFARKAKAFDMNIIYTSNNQSKEMDELGGVYVDKETLLRESDFLSLHVPLLPSTRHYIGEKELGLMKKTAILINTSRGPVVDEKALAKALKNGVIWGAGLDVFENEPEVDNELLELENVVLVPHIGSATIETRTNMGVLAARNIINVLSGEKPLTCVNPEVLGED